MTAEPHTCPRCGGDGEVHDARSRQMKSCKPCKGTGIVWDDPELREDAGVPEDALDLTYHPSN